MSRNSRIGQIEDRSVIRSRDGPSRLVKATVERPPQNKKTSAVPENIGFIDSILFSPALIFLDLSSSHFSATGGRKLGQRCV